MKQYLYSLFEVDVEKTKLGRAAAEAIFDEKESKETWFKLADGYSLILEDDGSIHITDAPWIKVRDIDDLLMIKKWISI